MKETYKVTCPKHIKWGDPIYFERYQGDELEKLVLDIYPPEGFVARLVLQEEPCKKYPDYKNRFMRIFMAPEQTIETYMQDMMYKGQEHTVKYIGVDSARYYLQVDDCDKTFTTGGDGCWGDYQEFLSDMNGEKHLDAAIVSILMSDDMTMEDVRQYANRFFEDMQDEEAYEQANIEEGMEMTQC
jgi:hypothetical protein